MSPAVGAAICAAGVAGALVMIAAALRGRADDAPFTVRRVAVDRIRARWSGRSISVLVAVAAGVAVWLASSWPVAGILATGMVLGLPYFFGAGRVAKARIERLEGLEEWTRRLADSIGTGVDPVQTIVRSAEHAPKPITKEVVTLANALATPRLDQSTALRSFADAIDDPLGDVVAQALAIAMSKDSSVQVPDVLRIMAIRVSDDVRARRQIEVLRAGPRREARSIVILQIVFLTGVVVFTDYAAPYGTALGQLVLAGIAAVMLIALVLLRKFSQSPAPPRMLTPGGSS